MVYSDPHLSDQDLLLTADGELPERRQSEIRHHLQACWNCRCRMAEMERTIGDFVGAYHSLLDPQVPPGNGSDSLLRARLLKESAESNKRWSFSRAAEHFLNWRWASAAACALVLTVTVGAIVAHRRTQQLAVSGLEAGTIPNSSLTPGETIPISKSDVCQANPPGENQEVPATLREAVFAEYGMKNSQNAYEVDFLITPALGGSASIRNLWPEPYHSRTWNAYRKDVLEERLHALVCSGDIDLATAQREIATNWVAAYKKYVGRDNATWFSAEQRR